MGIRACVIFGFYVILGISAQLIKGLGMLSSSSSNYEYGDGDYDDLGVEELCNDPDCFICYKPGESTPPPAKKQKNAPKVEPRFKEWFRKDNGIWTFRWVGHDGMQ